MINIGKIDFESNRVTTFMDLDESRIVLEDEFEISDCMKMYSSSNSAEVWVDLSLIEEDGKAMLRVLPTKLPIGYNFRLVPNAKLVSGSVYLITDQLVHRYKLIFNEKE